MYPHERSLVQRLNNEPFALVGVNADDNRQHAQSVKRSRQLTWRSFFDGPGFGNEIVQKFQVPGLPTIFLLDHNGVIRHRFFGVPREEVLNQAIDTLVKNPK